MNEGVPKKATEFEVQQTVLEKLQENQRIVTTEVSPYIQFVDEYELDDDLEQQVRGILAESYGFFEDLLEAAKRYLKGPLIKDSFGNYHIQADSEGQSRKDFIRSFGSATLERELLDQNRLKIGTYTNVIAARVSVIREPLLKNKATKELFTAVFAKFPDEILTKVYEREELSEHEKQEFVTQLDDFALALLQKTQLSKA